jgi:hypothetical protein
MTKPHHKEGKIKRSRLGETLKQNALRRILLFAVFLLEFLYATSSIHKHFLARKEWM